MSLTRTLRNRISTQISIAVAGSAVAVAAVLSSAAVGVSGRAANPAVAPGAVMAADGPGHAAPPAGRSAASALRAEASGSILLTAYTAQRKHLTPRQIAKHLLVHRFHWKLRRQFPCLNRLWERESGWNRYASNPYSGAYGIPQAVPGSKMSSAGPDWRSNAHTQILWGLRYIRDRYGTPRKAWQHETSYGWY